MARELQGDFEGTREGGRSGANRNANTDDSPSTQRRTRQDRARLVVLGGIFGAALASSCCVVPLLLVTLGVSGAWIGNLTALSPYKPYFLTAAALFLAGGFWHVYSRPRIAWVPSSYCEQPGAGRITRTALWIGVVLAGLAATIGFWAPLFY